MAKFLREGTKDVLKIMFEQGGDPEEIVKEKGLAQTSDDSFIKISLKK